MVIYIDRRAHQHLGSAAVELHLFVQQFAVGLGHGVKSQISLVNQSLAALTKFHHFPRRSIYPTFTIIT
jgi:hypothetical protein